MSVTTIQLEIPGRAPRKVPVTDRILHQLEGVSCDRSDLAYDMISRCVRCLNAIHNNAPRSRAYPEAIGVYTDLTEMLGVHFGRTAAFWRGEITEARETTYGNL